MRKKRLQARELFSLTAHFDRRDAREREQRERRKGRVHVLSAQHFDDGCPLCVAARDGTDASPFFMPPDGGPPALPTEYLIREARKALEEETPLPGAPVAFGFCGSVRPDDTVLEGSFLVDWEGQILWKSDTQERVLARLDGEGLERKAS